MKLRKLKTEDAPLMLEWMHDDELVHYLRHDFAGNTIDDCILFITEAQDESESIHLAVADDNDEYMGTVSLKHIQKNTAEFGIVLRSCARGDGYAVFGMNEIIKYGYRTRGIDTVYWCVDPDNQRAVSFYEKYDHHGCEIPEEALGYTDDEKSRYLWYRVQRRMVSDEAPI